MLCLRRNKYAFVYKSIFQVALYNCSFFLLWVKKRETPRLRGFQGKEERDSALENREG